ncbi:ATP-dependent metalloprotease FtsH [Paludibacter propionicigenes WB4]|uniref:ATP-dependent zinc metalloprotease FtsH n=1 Tax=Paludibacter propionicigenes (strain DSM 17365 / JCM 13257 / WB4) TaxID=694427 RepID=E4T8D1_PALPW|nr:ATP-dependent zinc metalloprotease FtsH [Paludibacter propionicigenes]ADQ80975.1 ATP-dependent metalloprotease FtsH [Paludibacter propionicigenes WB4]
MENKAPNQKPIKPTNKFPKFSFSWIYGTIILLLVGSYFIKGNTPPQNISMSTFEGYVKAGMVKKIDVYSSKNEVEAQLIDYTKVAVDTNFLKRTFGAGYKSFAFNATALKDSLKRKDTQMLKLVYGKDYETYSKDRLLTVTGPAEEFATMVRIAKEKSGVSVDVTYKDSRDYVNLFLYSILPILLLVFFFMFINRRMSGQMGGGSGGIFNVGKSKAQLFDKGDTTNKVTFKDVAGLAEAKQEIEEIVSFLKNPLKYTELGGKIPKGALLVGPPGTGKTLLAKAVAGEADVPFFSMSGSDFVEMFVGVGASRVRDLFRQAKEKAPCIIFIDEIDAVGRARGKNPNMGSNDERENTLNQLLTEMDGFGSNSGVIILAATNRADILDKALLRAGRFDRQIHVDLPDVHERKQIFNVHLRPIKINETVDVNFLSRQTPGFSGADIANVCNEAALIAARKNKSFVEKQDFLDAVDRIVGGLEKKTKITTNAEKKSIAYHEAGHATISWMTEHANPLVKVTIVPRGEALGAAWYLPEERQLTNREHMLDEMCSTLGGRAAEEVFLHQMSTGAINDLERVTKRAYSMVAYFGMSDKLANMSYYDSTGNSDYGFTKPYSEKTAELIDSEAKNIVAVEYERAKKILLDNAEGHNKLAELLIEKEVIFAEDLEKIFGKRPWTSRNDELMAQNGNVDSLEDTNPETPELTEKTSEENADQVAE